MASASLALLSPTITPPTSKPSNYFHHHHHHCNNLRRRRRHHHHNNLSLTCKASSSSSSSLSSSFVTEYDLYDLMGIDRESDQKEIKKAYRSLQKRCHPDIAGPAGHDMAIILNQAYALLSDPVARFAYDKEQAKMTELQGYTGQPMYSSWQGPESEQRAVFVDEVKCIGCLKCALFAKQTFAIEAAYGRARVVAQWADPEDKIQASIDVCPVNCIAMVERSDLAALEFLMSKLPRGNVRIGASNTAGARSFDVFSEVKVFHKRLNEAATRKSNRNSEFIQSEARISAIQAIRSISNWLYWQSPASDHTPTGLTFKGVTGSVHPDVEKLRDAATEARRHGMFNTRENSRLLPQTTTSRDDYWTPSTPVQANDRSASDAQTAIQTPAINNEKTIVQEKAYVNRKDNRRRPLVTALPVGLAVLAAINAMLHGAGNAVGGVEQHMGGPFALLVVNSSWMQVFLAGVPWYFIGIAFERFVEGLSNKDRM